MNRGARATRTSAGRGGGNCWEMKSGPLCARVRPSGNYNRQRNACSTWRLDTNDVAPRAVLTQRQGFSTMKGRQPLRELEQELVVQAGLHPPRFDAALGPVPLQERHGQ